MRTIAPWHQNPQLWGFKLPQLRDSRGPHSSQPLAYPPLGYTKLMLNLPGFCRNCPSKKGSEAWACKLIQTISKAWCKEGRVSTEPDQEVQNWKRRWRPYPCPHIIDIKNDSKPQNNKKIPKNLFLFWHGESSQFLLKCKTTKKKMLMAHFACVLSTHLIDLLGTQHGASLVSVCGSSPSYNDLGHLTTMLLKREQCSS